MYVELYVAINHKMWQVEWGLVRDMARDVSVFIPDFLGETAMDTPEKNDHVRQKMFDVSDC